MDAAVAAGLVAAGVPGLGVIPPVLVAVAASLVFPEHGAPGRAS